MGAASSSNLDTFPSPLTRLERQQTPPKTLLDTEWRKVGDLTKELEGRLMEEIQIYETGHSKIKNARILLLGPIRAGKSSFINTIASVDWGKIAEPVMSGEDITSLSKELIIYRPGGKLRGFRVIDTMGVEDAKGMGFHVEDVTSIIQGKVKPNYKFNPQSPISDKDADYIKNPKLKDTASCVAFIMDARTVRHGSISEKTQAKIDLLQDAIKKVGVKRILILTHIDRLCPEVAKDLRKVFWSIKVKEAVEIGSQIFGIPGMNVFPIENYHDEHDTDPPRNILTLLALRQAMNFSSDYLKLKARMDGPHSSSEEN